MAIRSFGDALTEDLYHGRSTARARRVSPSLVEAAVRKLDLVNAAGVLDDLKTPPGNRLELLSGHLAGFHSVRVNQQWRIVFRWSGTDAHDVGLIDYH